MVIIFKKEIYFYCSNQSSSIACNMKVPQLKVVKCKPNKYSSLKILRQTFFSIIGANCKIILLMPEKTESNKDDIGHPLPPADLARDS